MPPPTGCPRAIYKLMVDCWNPDKLYRPCFREIVNLIIDNSSEMLARTFTRTEMRDVGKLATNIGNSIFPDLQTRYQVKKSYSSHLPISNQI